MSDLIVFAECREFGRGWGRGFELAAFWVVHEAPEVAVTFFAGKTSGINSIAF
jgi:hypothetical protein